MKKEVLVAGGAGFLGSHLCDKLLLSKREVLCIDKLFIGSKQNLAHLLTNSMFSLVAT